MLIILLFGLSSCVVETQNDNPQKLLCANLNQDDTKSITVKADIDDSSCSPDIYPWGRNPLWLTYPGIKHGHQFGENTNGSVVVDIPMSQFAAIGEFTTPITPFRRVFNWVPAPRNYWRSESAVLSVSTCPGDFSSTANCVMPFGPQDWDNTRFSTKASDQGNDLYCQLAPNTTYYLNIMNYSCEYNESSCAVFFSEGALN